MDLFRSPRRRNKRNGKVVQQGGRQGKSTRQECRLKSKGKEKMVHWKVAGLTRFKPARQLKSKIKLGENQSLHRKSGREDWLPNDAGWVASTLGVKDGMLGEVL